MTHEDRVRVVFNLPMTNAAEEKALGDIVEYVQELKTKRIGVSGFTQSQLWPPAFIGFWWDSKTRNWCREGVCIMIVDLLASVGTTASHLERLKKTIQNSYSARGSKQQEIWIVAHQVTRID